MAELAFQDRLQPALLDRLSDDMRSIPVVEVRASRALLAERAVTVDAIELAVRPFGLRPWRPEQDARSRNAASPEPDEYRVLQFSGPVDGASLARVRSAPVAARGQPLTLQQLGEVVARTVINSSLEPAEQRVVSMRKLRESVLRDLGWLLSTASFDTGRSLAAWPEVERSVLNYGLPSVAGLGAVGQDPVAAARRLQRALEYFEPRLRQIRVTPDLESAPTDGHALAFRIEAELWGQPTPQRLTLRTQIDVETADVVITDAEPR
jgi:type VI secretion system lysozyme-like protein